MPLVRISGLVGRFFVPQCPPGKGKKHDCADCQFCQWCTDDRCAACRSGGECCKRKAPVGVKRQVSGGTRRH
ncbi:MAG: hypothetical protein A3K19_21625 [Lentisphaerae bacterium RIFOXYB12_FULL_65_16]|nr:MAG: hypothetical protein A3K18_20875 [Lentisphaerae bacterium RIFOXYA12_64_32]OGV93868.1 MAG: hypothetical protein A3K19_21625 [Lentisphaerae bacterium RIFOXYB12_FULL_65_16]